MQGSWIDSVWASMREGKYYSVQDLANASGCPRTLVANVTDFLAKYGFAEKIGRSEPLFTRAKLELSPTETIKLLECITEPEVAAELPSLKEPTK